MAKSMVKYSQKPADWLAGSETWFEKHAQPGYFPLPPLPEQTKKQSEKLWNRWTLLGLFLLNKPWDIHSMMTLSHLRCKNSCLRYTLMHTVSTKWRHLSWASGIICPQMYCFATLNIILLFPSVNQLCTEQYCDCHQWIGLPKRAPVLSINS